MKWTEAFATGIPRIDEQHRTLFKTTDDFRLALDEGKGEASYGLLLDFLEHYTRAHFGFEERCMEQYHCPVAAKNKQAHAGFIDILGEFRERFARNGFRATDAREHMDTVERWLSGHIGHTDVALREYVEKK